MGMVDDSRKEEFLAHIFQMLSDRDDMVILSVKGLSEQTRQTAQMMAKEYGEHITNDLIFWVASTETVKDPESDIMDDSDNDFEMWANELK